MNPTLATFSSPCTAVLPLKSLSSSAPLLAFPSPNPLRLRACCFAKPDFVAQKLQSLTKTAVFVGATALVIGKFSNFPARADPVPVTEVEKEPALLGEKEAEDPKSKQTSSLSAFLESGAEAVEAMKAFIHLKLESQEEEEAAGILNRLKAREVFDEILQSDPFAYETLYEYALLMDRCGEGEDVLKRLEGVVALAQKEKKPKEARDVRFIISQLHFLQNNLDKALLSYQQLAKEDPTDSKPYFCQGLIYRMLNMNEEAQKQFSKCQQSHTPEGHLRPRL
ncbi:hypothetical protein F3Y22_tig00110893pilonHSYRG00708 [Hibiscus syriacus]|uniref:Uncharacterized protein n=1 Tax=Hibiscus syriacus TaxID=106335 RepID=A0A6A2ZFV8_HIBSY|nr:hypothetical protein F3Y22_tig00110893pilonHSYRG00708 [Hibiscus syriacus]